MKTPMESRLLHTVRIALLILIAAIVVLPFFWTIMLSFKSNEEILLNPATLPVSLEWSNYRKAFETLPLARMYYNTFVNIIVSETLTLLLIYPSSYALAKIPFRRDRLRRFIYTFLLLGLMIPAYILVFPDYQVNIVLRLMNTRMALLLPIVATNISFDTLLLVGAMRAIPNEVEESAIIDGSGMVKLCLHISAPMIVPTLVTVTVFNVLHIWNEYMFSSLYLTDQALVTLPLGMSYFQGRYSMDYAGMIAATVLIIVPQLFFYTVFQKKIISGLTAGAVKG